MVKLIFIHIFAKIILTTYLISFSSTFITELTLHNSIKNNEYVQAVHSVAECIVGRIDNPLLQLSFFYKLSSIGRKFYRSVEVLHNNTARVGLHFCTNFYFLKTYLKLVLLIKF